MLDLEQILKVIGPNAAIIFAAWIFMGFLQQRYDSALDRYLRAVGDYRSGEHEKAREENLRDEVLVYRRRCKIMGTATLTGLVAAILLIVTLIIGIVDVLVPDVPLIAAAGTATAVLGFLAVIAAAILVIIEGRIVSRQIDAELLDVPALAEAAGQDPGSIKAR